LAARLFQRKDDNGISGIEAWITFSVYLFPSLGEGMPFRVGKRHWNALLSGLLALTACTATPTGLESTPTAVTVRYDGIANSIDDATQVAQKACAARGKTARLRKVSDQGI